MAKRVNKEAAVTAILFIISVVVTELHQVFKNTSKDVSSWFAIPLNYQLDVQWYVHDIGKGVQDILWAAIGIRLSKGRGLVIRGIVFTWLGYSIIDLILYLLCYQIYGYEILLIITGGAITVLLSIRLKK